MKEPVGGIAAVPKAGGLRVSRRRQGFGPLTGQDNGAQP